MKTINTVSKIPKHRQAASIIKHRILTHRYKSGTNLPPVRMLGAELGVTSNVIQRALRILAREGLVKQQHGVGVTVIQQELKDTSPLKFAFVQPFFNSSAFSGHLYCSVEEAIDKTQNVCILKSSNFSHEREREICEQLLGSVVEAIIIWPCPGNENVEYFTKLMERIPIIFVDSKPGDLPAPCVTFDFASLGRDIVLHLASQGFDHILILEEPPGLRTFTTMFESMHETVAKINGIRRFDFAPLNTTNFVLKYPQNLVSEYEIVVNQMRDLLQQKPYQAIFSVQDSFLDWTFVCSSLSKEFPALKVYSLTTKESSHKSPEFYHHAVRSWQYDWQMVFSKTVSILQDMVFLRNKPKRTFLVKFIGLDPLEVSSPPVTYMEGDSEPAEEFFAQHRGIQ